MKAMNFTVPGLVALYLVMFGGAAYYFQTLIAAIGSKL